MNAHRCVAVALGVMLMAGCSRGDLESLELGRISQGATLAQKSLAIESGPPSGGDNFGRAVATTGSIVVVGASFDDATGPEDGLVHVYDSSGAHLFDLSSTRSGFGAALAVGGGVIAVGSRSGDVDLFDASSALFLRSILGPGISAPVIAIEGGILAIADPTSDLGAPDAGIVRLFDVATGALLRQVDNPSPVAGDQFGSSVALAGGRLFVGVPRDDTGALNAGVVEVFTVSTGTNERTIPNPLPNISDFFGGSLSATSLRLLVGAHNDRDIPGGAFYFEASTGALFDTLTNPSGNLGEEFGGSVSLESSFDLLVGTPGATVGGIEDAGAVYHFLPGGALIETLTDLDPREADRFGEELASVPNRLVVGAPLDDSDAPNAGSAALHVLSSSNVTPLVNPSVDSNAEFGGSIAIEGELMVVGARNAGVSQYGAASLVHVPTAAVLTNFDNPTALSSSDEYGMDVDFDGEVVAVSARRGNGNFGSVSLYRIFEPEAFASFSNPGLLTDDYGTSISLEGGLVLVGAPLEDTGASDAGVAYLHDAATGGAIRTLLNPTPAASEQFAFQVQLSEGLALVSEPREGEGVVHVFDAATGALLRSIVDPDPNSSQFGNSFSAHGGRVAIADLGSDTFHVFDLATGALLSGPLTGSTLAMTAQLIVAGSPDIVRVYHPETFELLASVSNPEPDFFAGDGWGTSVAAWGSTFAIGAPFDDAAFTNGGAVYAYTLGNQTPVAAADAVAGTEDVVLPIPRATLSANDTDGDGDALVVVEVGLPSHGTAVISGADVVYTPAADFNGSDAFSYTVRDASGATATAMVVVTVAPANDDPVAAPETVLAVEDTPLTIAVTANDGDLDGDPLAVSIVTQASNGTAVVSGTYVLYTPAADHAGNDSFVYQVADGAGGTATALVTVSVVGVNDGPPTLVAVLSPLDGETVATGTPVLEVDNATDSDGGALVYEFQVDVEPTFATSALLSSGEIAEGTGSTSWTVPAQLDEDRRYWWRARARDAGFPGEWVTASLRVSRQNDAPGAPSPLGPLDAVTPGGTPTLTIANAADPEGDALTYEFEVRTDDTEATVVASHTGIGEGAGGQTSVTLTEALREGGAFVWRARAVDTSTSAGPWSADARFSVDSDEGGGGGGGGCGCAIGGAREARPSALGIGLAALGLAAVLRTRRRASRE